jgi:surface protein
MRTYFRALLACGFMSTTLLWTSCSNNDDGSGATNLAPQINPQSFTVPEDISDLDVIGVVVASDPDDDHLTFSITQNSGSLFEITDDGIISLSANRTLDFETMPSHTIEVSVTDGIHTSSAAVMITLTQTYDPFITVWEVGFGGSVGLPLYESTSLTQTSYNFTVDWGDGSTGIVTSFDDPDATHSYTNPGEYTVTIVGELVGFNFTLSASPVYRDYDSFKDVKQWGDVNLGDDAGIFFRCSLLESFSANDPFPLSTKTNLNHLFLEATNFNEDISNWDVNHITEMEGTFKNANRFNQDISNWDVSNVTNMAQMFQFARDFNQDIGNWDVSKVTSMRLMFSGAGKFNQDISNWDVSNVKSMNSMFGGAGAFNQDIGSWDTHQVEDMMLTFGGAGAFNQDISDWDVSNVNTMYGMFTDATSFNQPLNNWDVSSVVEMQTMFVGATSFDRPLDRWDMTNVVSTAEMFARASSFNQPVNSWDISNVTDMQGMFREATSFDQDLSDWTPDNVVNCEFFSSGSAMSSDDLPIFKNCNP